MAGKRQGPDWTFWGIGLGVAGGLFSLGMWIMVWMPGSSFRGAPPPLAPLESALQPRLQRHLDELAWRIGERNLWHPEALEAAALYIERAFVAAGLSVRRHSYEVMGREVSNLVADIPGSHPGEGMILVGAHYDSVRGSPGANDNGSGVAILLEMARLLAEAKPRRTLRLAAFVNEEPPFFQTDLMGSRVYARQLRRQGEEVAAMLSLETLGYYSDEPGSQRFPSPLLKLCYPDRGDFLAFVGNLSSRSLVRQAIGAFRGTTPFPSEGLAGPAWLAGVDWSDQWSFWQEGIPALMVTDTAPYRYPHYHLPSDTPDRIDTERLARVALGLAGVAAELAGIPPET